jgi:molybdenum cofactor guanylyltransferase
LKTGCVILAGGKGSRLGRDKAWVDLGGQTLLERAVANLELIGEQIVIVTANGQQLPPLRPLARLKIVTDINPGQGPLVGIYTGLMNSPRQNNMVVACDMPFLNRRLVEHMLSVAPGFDVVVPRLGARLEPLHAVYARSCLAPIASLLARGSLKIDCLLELVRVRYIGEDELVRFDPSRLSFFNINTPEDLARAQELISRSQN